MAGETVTAALMNTHVRDNFNALLWSAATVATSETTTSTSYTDLATSGPAVTLTTLTTVMILISGACYDGTGGQIAYISSAVSGATTVAAADTRCMATTQYTANPYFQGSYSSLLAGLTAGSNTFTLKYKVSGGTGTFINRNIAVLALNT